MKSRENILFYIKLQTLNALCVFCYMTNLMRSIFVQNHTSLHGDVIILASKHSWLAFKVTKIEAAHRL